MILAVPVGIVDGRCQMLNNSAVGGLDRRGIRQLGPLELQASAHMLFTHPSKSNVSPARQRRRHLVTSANGPTPSATLTPQEKMKSMRKEARALGLCLAALTLLLLSTLFSPEPHRFHPNKRRANGKDPREVAKRQMDGDWLHHVSDQRNRGICDSDLRRRRDERHDVPERRGPRPQRVHLRPAERHA